MRSGILHRRAVQSASFNARLRLIVWHVARVGLPTTSTPAKSSQAHERDERHGRAGVSIYGAEFGGGQLQRKIDWDSLKRSEDF